MDHRLDLSVVTRVLHVLRPIAAAAFLLAWAVPVAAQEAAAVAHGTAATTQAQTSQAATGDTAGQVGGPSSVQGQLSQDSERRRIRSIKDLGNVLRTDYGLSLGLDYNALPQQVSSSPGDTAAAGGVFRFYGHWTPFNRESASAGSVVFKAEHRHTLGTDIPPQLLGPTAGLASITAPVWSDAGGLLTNLYWTQAFADNRFAFNAGVVDVTDYVDVFGLVNVWTDFSNLAFSTSPSIPAPSQGLGAVARWMITPNVYAVGGLADANGNPHHPEDFFSSFFGDAEYFWHAELGWIGSWDNRYSDNVHVTVWHADAREAAGVDSGTGVTLSLSRTIGDWTPFVRAGFSDGGGVLVDRTVSVGVGNRLTKRTDDYAGVAFNWGRPPAGSAGEATRDQYTIEAYYRAQFTPELAVIPGVQFFVNPAFDPTSDNLWLLGLKIRLAL